MTLKAVLLVFSITIVAIASPFDTTLKEELSWLQDETFVISASKVKEELKKSTASVYIIDEETINTIGAHTLMEALYIVPGLDVVQSNIYVNQINVHGIQTFFSEKVLILLDGHSLNADLLDGGATNAYGNFPLDHVKRIEIIKSPSSALYGENAFMALINIITKEPKEIGKAKVSATLGSDNTYIANLLWGDSYDNFDIALDLNYYDTDGADVFVKEDAAKKSGYTHPYSKRYYANLFMQHASGIYLKSNYTHSKDGSRFGAVNILNNEDVSKREAWFIEAGYQYCFNEAYKLNTRFYRDFFQYNNKWRVYPAGMPTAEYTDGMLGYAGIDNIKTGVEAFMTFEHNAFTLVSGASYELQEIKNPWQKMNWNPVSGEPLTQVEDFSNPNTNYIVEQDRKFFALYGEVLYDFNDDLRLSSGIRYDHYSDFGGVFNPRLGLTYQIDTKTTLKLMYAEAFRAPTFAELYNINNPVSLGNRDLDPERINTLELTLQNDPITNLHLSLTLFQSRIDDIITIVGNTHVNQGAIATRGLEAQLKKDLNRGSYLLAHYTYQDPENSHTHETLPNIAKHTGYLALNYRINRYLNLYVDAKYTGTQTRLDGDPRESVKSTITDNAILLIKNFPIKTLQSKLFIDNIFNENRFNSCDPYDFPLAERSYGVEISYTF